MKDFPNSSAIKATEHHRKSNTLTVVYRSKNRVYTFENVTQWQYRKLRAAEKAGESVGALFNRLIPTIATYYWQEIDQLEENLDD